MQPTITTLAEKKLVGKHLPLSFADDRTAELWRSFMPHRYEVKNKMSEELFSMQMYGSSFNFNDVDLHAGFTKWAAVEVAEFTSVPEQMDTVVVPGGLYAVFHYKGLNTDTGIFRYIFSTWLPGSEFEVDNRPHFEILGAKYKNNDPNSEEEIWIPIKNKFPNKNAHEK